MEVIDLDAPTTNSGDGTVTPKVPSLQRAVDEAIAASVARPTFASQSPTPTGTSTQEVRQRSGTKSYETEAEQSFTHSIE